MKHLAITNDFFPNIGGAHTWLYEVCRRAPHPVEILASDAPEAVAAQATAFDQADHGAATIQRINSFSGDIDILNRAFRKRMGQTAKRIASFADNEAVTFHCLRAFPEGLQALWAKSRWIRQARIVVYAHGEEILVAKSSRQLRLIAQLVYRYSSLVIANSSSTEALVRGLSPRANVVRISPGADVAVYRKPPSVLTQYRARWGWPAETVIACTIGRLEKRKNHAAVIRALSTLRGAGVPVAYVCCGGGDEFHALESLIHDLGLQQFVRLPGVLSDEEKILTLGSSDFHIMPSIQVGEMIEGYGISFIEGAAAGVPSISGNVGGQPEAVIDGRTGLVVDGKSDKQVHDAMRRLATDANLRMQMGSAGRTWALQHDWNIVARSIWNLVQTHTEQHKSERA